VKYVIMFTSDPAVDAGLDPDAAKAEYAAVYQWFADHGADLADGGAELQPVTTATTVRAGGDGTVVVDGPFSEAKEVIGGFSILDVPDMDAAIAVVKSWPMLQHPGRSVEIRPMVTDYSHMEQ
jgi:hypothetical protein